MLRAKTIPGGDTVCSRATHKGTFFGITPTAKVVTMTGLTLVRVADGCIHESWVKNDVMGLLKQLGRKVL